MSSSSSSLPSTQSRATSAAPAGELTGPQRMVSASIGAVLTSIFVTPLNVIKTRLQAQVPVTAGTVFADCSHVRMTNGLMDYWCHKCELPLRTPDSHLTGLWDTLRKIVKGEGVGSLWRGLSPTLLMSVPGTVVYFCAYDALHERFDSSEVPLAPLVAGSCARTLTTTIFSPLELIRTKEQAALGPTSMSSIARAEMALPGGWRNLWRGYAATMWRDVPFSAMYWLTYEELKPRFRRAFSSGGDLTTPSDGGGGASGLFAAAFASGVVSGSLATIITQPFDLAKTRYQIELYSFSMHRQAAAAAAAAAAAGEPAPPVSRPQLATAAILRDIVREEGYAGLLSGLSARLYKVGPACAIMISSYEVAKLHFSTQRLPV